MPENELKKVVATILMLSPDQVGAHTSLASLDNSLGHAKLRLAVKRLGLAMPAGLRPTSFGEFCNRLEKGPAGAEPPVARIDASHPSAIAGARVGLDLQEISGLPLADDYWNHSFYEGAFNKSEIAYAIAQPEPRVHFAGFWCAKEALRKCDERFFGVNPTATAVEHAESGSPYFVWRSSEGDQPLPHSLSISHAAGIAMAVVMAVFPSPPLINMERSWPRQS
jgi:phosphopantetheinyl transferase (holo-ACP synthase)